MTRALTSRLERLEASAVPPAASVHVGIPDGVLDDASYDAWAERVRREAPPDAQVLLVRFVEPGHVAAT